MNHIDFKCFDWIKAAEIIKERKPNAVMAGLSGDWDYTCDYIYKDGKIVENCDPYLESYWAIPSLILDNDGFNVIPCFVINHPEWDAHTVWPEEAKKILEVN